MYCEQCADLMKEVESLKALLSETQRPMKPLLALRLRNLIAAREFNAVQANRELQAGDDWLCDHGQRDRELEDEINALLKQIKGVIHAEDK